MRWDGMYSISIHLRIPHRWPRPAKMANALRTGAASGKWPGRATVIIACHPRGCMVVSDEGQVRSAGETAAGPLAC